MLIKIEAIVREEKMEDVKAALNRKTGRSKLSMPYRKQRLPVIPAMERSSAMRYATLFVSVQVRPDTMRCSRSFCKIIKM